MKGGELNDFLVRFVVSFLQLICKASLIFQSNLELALSIILKERELYKSKHVAVECRCLTIWDLLSFLICRWWYKELRVRLGVAFGHYLHFFCLSVYCHVTRLCSLCQPVMVSCLRCKNLWISMTTLIIFLFTLGKPRYFHDVKSIVLSLRPAPDQTLSPLYNHQEA